MLERSFARLCFCTMCGFAMVQFNLADALLAQQTPPRLPPPRLERPGGNRTQNDGDDDADTANDRDAGSRTDKAKPKFDELLGDQDLSRFRGYEEEAIGAGWKMDGQYLHFDGSSVGDIITKKEYDNFELQFDYKVSRGANSGVLFRVALGDDKPDRSGPEFQILDDEEHVDGKNVLTSTGSLYGLYPCENKKLRPAGSWNSVRIIADGNRITYYLNSVKALEAEIGSDDWNRRLAKSKFKDSEKFARNSRGYIAFQENGDEVWFRKIRIKDLTEESTIAKESPESGSRTPEIGRSNGPPPNKYSTPNRRQPRFYNESMKLKGADDKDKNGDKDK